MKTGHLDNQIKVFMQLNKPLTNLTFTQTYASIQSENIKSNTKWLHYHLTGNKVIHKRFPHIIRKTILNLKTKGRGFPGGAVVENLPATAGDTGSSPGLGGSHMPRSGWAREPRLLSLRVWSLCPAMGGAAIVKGPRTAMKSGPCTAMKSGPHLP